MGTGAATIAHHEPPRIDAAEAIIPREFATGCQRTVFVIGPGFAANHF